MALAYYLSEIKLYKAKLIDFWYRARLYSEILAKIHKKPPFGPLDGDIRSSSILLIVIEFIIWTQTPLNNVLFNFCVHKKNDSF